MAKQEGIVKLTGTIGDITLYKTASGYKARQKGGNDASKIKSDPAFARTRENNEEFGTSASAGKLLRDTIRPLLMTSSDSFVTSRLSKTMAQIKNLDPTSARGKRNVGIGIHQSGAMDMLKGFNFNKRAILESMLFIPYSLNNASGEISISGLIPMTHLIAPQGATHVSFKGAWAKVDFAANTSDVSYSNVVSLPLNTNTSNVLLTPTASPAGSGTDFYFLNVEFFQQVNGIPYPLLNGVFNAMSIIEVL